MAEIKIPLKIALNPIKSTFFIFTFYFLLLPCLTSYFSTVIKRKTGKSVNSWIAGKTVAEAQALLARSTESVQEIAFRLGFKDAAHFSGFFNKYTQLSPVSFRQGLSG